MHRGRASAAHMDRAKQHWGDPKNLENNTKQLQINPKLPSKKGFLGV